MENRAEEINSKTDVFGMSGNTNYYRLNRWKQKRQ